MLSKSQIAQTLTMLLSDDEEQLMLAHAILRIEFPKTEMSLPSGIKIIIDNFIPSGLFWYQNVIISAYRDRIKKQLGWTFVYSPYTKSFKWYGTL